MTIRLLIILLLLACIGCHKEPASDAYLHPHPPKDKPKPTKKTAADDAADYSSFLIPHEEDLEGYTFRYGYTAYNEDKYGHSNPGYIEVKKDGKVLYKNSFEGYDEPYINIKGVHNLNGNRLVFTLNYGTEACDYTQFSRYYVIHPDNSVSFLKECWGGWGGDFYATRYYKEFFPEDSAGIPNTMGIVEGILYNEHDQPDRVDTTRIIFSGNRFKAEKLTDNLAKAE
ncbi:hypothetical protein ACLI1A_13285 [Flavobacterium sp. RHBU_3]|uniref:hypothetical protein n=1 Tax=Flavobacterium sp. RHBU_3 TaxID=3391184 RepID=UPI0039855C6D